MLYVEAVGLCAQTYRILGHRSGQCLLRHQQTLLSLLPIGEFVTKHAPFMQEQSTLDNQGVCALRKRIVER